MEESDLLKERLQAITDKRRIQEDIRMKRQELDIEKLKLQYLKKKSLREKWLFEESSSQNASRQQQILLSDQQMTRALQNNIHRIEKEVEFLEREESMISTNESFILKRLKAVEKSPHEIIKEAQESFIPEVIKVKPSVADLPESFTPAGKPTLDTMEINMAKHLTGESKVFSTAVMPGDRRQHSGVKGYDDGRKCVYALETQQRSHDQGSELSPREVAHLLREASRHGNGRRLHNNHQNGHPSGEHGHKNQNPRNNKAGEDCLYSNNKIRNLQAKQGETHHPGYQRNHYSNLEMGYHHRNIQGAGQQYTNRDGERTLRRNHEEHRHGNRFSNDIITSTSRVHHDARSNSGPPPRSHDQEAVSTYQPELCYTPANHIPFRDYISVDDEELYLYSPPPYHNQSEAISNGDHQTSAFFYRSARSERAPSPLYEADAPYTILSAMETTEPITAVFMGFQTTQDDSGSGHEYEGSLKAELVIIDDASDANNSNDGRWKGEEKNGHPAGLLANQALEPMDQGRATEPGIRKIRKQHKACCMVC